MSELRVRKLRTFQLIYQNSQEKLLRKTPLALRRVTRITIAVVLQFSLRIPE